MKRLCSDCGQEHSEVTIKTVSHRVTPKEGSGNKIPPCPRCFEPVTALLLHEVTLPTRMRLKAFGHRHVPGPFWEMKPCGHTVDLKDFSLTKKAADSDA